jgi:hypothetical protein
MELASEQGHVATIDGILMDFIVMACTIPKTMVSGVSLMILK